VAHAARCSAQGWSRPKEEPDPIRVGCERRAVAMGVWWRFGAGSGSGTTLSRASPAREEGRAFRVGERPQFAERHEGGAWPLCRMHAGAGIPADELGCPAPDGVPARWAEHRVDRIDPCDQNGPSLPSAAETRGAAPSTRGITLEPGASSCAVSRLAIITACRQASLSEALSPPAA
jgi:hypothetical protein